jgi:GDP-4-dehydro-6-deoxy-D-mannose reductase
VSTAQVYGTRIRSNPVCEADALAPESLYAITKAAADGIARFYARQYGMNVLVARPYNHIGPGQDPSYVTAAFARQVLAIKRGAPPRLSTGNLDSLRDFTDVRDICRAYSLLLEKGIAGAAYNIASGRLVKVGDVLSKLCSLAGVQPEIARDPSLYRPIDSCLTLDTRLLQDATGWRPRIPLDQTLADILEYA